tara:strand:+ start:383 stop:523 length:141 start_codon:yes stop_codon:yes gene_type:complete
MSTNKLPEEATGDSGVKLFADVVNATENPDGDKVPLVTQLLAKAPD